MKINVEPRVKRIGGVGKAQLFGSNYSMRLWLKPDKMAGYGLIPDDISAVLARQNIEPPPVLSDRTPTGQTSTR